MAGKREQILDALTAAIAGGTTAAVVRNDGRAVAVPAAGRIVVWDGDWEAPEPAGLSGPPWYHSGTVGVEIYVEGVDQAARDAAMAGLLEAVEVALGVDETLGGRAFGLVLGAPVPDQVDEEAATTQKAVSLPVTVEYQSDRATG